MSFRFVLLRLPSRDIMFLTRALSQRAELKRESLDIDQFKQKIEKQAKNRNETISNLSLGTRLTEVYGIKKFEDTKSVVSWSKIVKIVFTDWSFINDKN